MYLLDLVEGLHRLAARSDKEGVGGLAGERVCGHPGLKSPHFFLSVSAVQRLSQLRIALG